MLDCRLACVCALTCALSGCSSVPARHGPPQPTAAVTSNSTEPISPQGTAISPDNTTTAVRPASFNGADAAPLDTSPDPPPQPLRQDNRPENVGPADIQSLPTRQIDLPTALSIAAGQNPQVAFASARVSEAFAQLDRADALWLPSINAGVNYNKHEGRIQDVAGNVFDTSRGGLYSGLGAQAVGAGSPAVPGVVARFHLSDAVFQPRIAESFASAQRYAGTAATNDVLLATSLAYLELLVAAQQKAIVADTLRNAEQLADLTASYARSGQGTQADADRAQAELAFRRVELARSEEAVQVASVRLARQLSQDPTEPLVPVERAIVPIDMVNLECSATELVSIGLTSRPELAESRWLVREAIDRLNRERHAPLLPSVLLGASYGGFGGGLGGDITNFGDRFDFDAAAYWEIRNLGHGEWAATDVARSRIDLARFRQLQIMDQVASEVAEAHTQVLARRRQIDIAEEGVRSATGSYDKNVRRIRDGQGLPLEVLQSLQALDQSQRQYLRTIADYNEAQFRLQRALGWPIQVGQSHDSVPQAGILQKN